MAKHEITIDQLQENPEKWGKEVAEQIELELMLLNVHVKGISDMNVELEGEANFAGIPRLLDKDPDDRRKSLKRVAVHNAFLSMFRHIVIYVDKVLALYLYAKETQQYPVPVDSIENFDEFFATLPLEKYKEFSRDRKSFPDKIELFEKLNQRTKDRLLAFNAMRNAFEHQGGIAKKEISFPMSSYEIREKDEHGLATVDFKLDQPVTKEFNVDEEIILSPLDVQTIGRDIIGWVIKDILNVLTEEETP